MAFGLTIGTERATTLQNAVQDELTKRGYSMDADPVMAEYITIMIINNKTAAQISSELEDLIGPDFDPSFVDWLFAEVAKGAPEAVEQPPAVPEPTQPAASQPRPRDDPPHVPADTSSRPSNGPRNSAPLYRQALAQAVPGTSPSAQKRPASARSPSPTGHVTKSRRVDLPTGPRAMQRDGGGSSGSRSLLDRMGPSRNNRAHDEIQARIDSITGAPAPDMMMMPGGGFPMNSMPGMDMAAMGGMGNPMMLQDMMMSQMAMMAQMAGAMGLLPGMGMNGQFQGQPTVGGDMGMMNNGINGPPHHGPDGRGRARGRGGPRGSGGRGRGGHHGGSNNALTEASIQPPQPSSSTTNDSASVFVTPNPVPTVAAPTPSPAPQLAPSFSQGHSSVVAPERPQSPTLCKFGLKCTNAVCRYSHPSPVATPESGVVLSNDPCEAGKDCKDKDCVKAHVSPAVLKPQSEHLNPKAPAFTPSHSHHHAPAQSPIPCRFGAACTRPGCSFLHPARQTTTACRFGAACTKATCPFQHPEGRGALPSSFHRGLGTTGGLMDSNTSHNKSVTFNNSKLASAAELEKQVKEVEEKKNQVKAAVAQAQAAAAANKGDNTKSVSVAV